ncbi:SixA phosphatase family protein [Bradyrhizobium sp. DASA03076]|uniref:Phosphohistidine phosphatase n=1 Tax=Bradyrhizobium manausense TaxID=989370 RepID=A0A0R3DKR2_9BRAD|nr:histidine phosphatase family protein [Bradyrhizobium manausense]KRQ10422.1 phosphohistidine phosphatase [Bradyrhizobium manausense]
MRRLMLLRHAKTETDAPSGRDQDRRLDHRGQRDAAEMGDWMATHPPVPETVLVSHAVRARQTWDLAWEAMKDRVAAPRVEVLPELYGADPAQILETIRTATIPANPKRLLLVGHNPGMHEAALMLTGSGDKASAKALTDNLPTAGLAILDFDVKDWGDVAYRRGKLVLFVSPKLLRLG